jgi:predicted nucleic acid-binding protein
MVLVDTSVWIDFFQSPAAPAAGELETLIKDHNRVVLCGVVLQEVLQGIRSEKSYQLVRERLLKFPYIPDNRETWLLAAELYRQLRRKGITLPPVDVTIAAIAIRNDLLLFSRDSHFETVAQHTALRLHGSCLP